MIDEAQIEYRQEVEAIVETERQVFGHLTDLASAESESELSSEFILDCLNSNEEGDGRLFRELHNRRFCFDHSAGRWFEWIGHYWAEDRIEQVTEAMNRVVEVYGKECKRQCQNAIEAEREKDTKRADQHQANERALLKRIRTLQTKRRLKDVLYFSACGRDSLGITGDQWDQDPWVLGCVNGVVELQTGHFRPGRQEDWIRTVCPTEFKGLDIPAPTWEGFLREIFNEDEELIDYVQRVLGYGITGLSNQLEFYIMWGKGRNGKGTLFEVLGHVLGRIVAEAQKEILLAQRFKRRSGDPTSDIMALRGRRIVYAAETDEGRYFDVSQVKWLVGGDKLVGRNLYDRRQVEFSPTHTLFLHTNNKPHAPAEDYALWQRIRLIAFEMSFVDDVRAENERKRDPNMAEKLKVEASGILAWLVRGCLAWQHDGLNPPDTVRVATNEYQASEDIVGQFLEEKCIIKDYAQTKAGELYGAYKDWCEENGIKPISVQRFSKRMLDRFDRDTSGRYRLYIGVELKSDLAATAAIAAT